MLLRSGQIGRIWVRIGPKGDKALRLGQGDGQTDMDRRKDRCTDGQIAPVFYRTWAPSGLLLKNAKKVDSRKSVRWSKEPVPCLGRS